MDSILEDLKSMDVFRIKGGSITHVFGHIFKTEEEFHHAQAEVKADACQSSETNALKVVFTRKGKIVLEAYANYDVLEKYDLLRDRRIFYVEKE